jgi:hypothetical protein
MRREGCDPMNVRMSDVLCDFCGHEWSDALPMVEGHQGSCICGTCLSAAYRAVVLSAPPAQAAARCTLCLEQRDEPTWQAPAAPATACRRCVRQSAAVLAKDPDLGWRKPDSGDIRPAVP